MIHATRIHDLNDAPSRGEGEYVLYWMQASQRTRFNHVLEYAIDRANEHALPLVVGFGLMDDYPEANARHYAFMLQGLAHVRKNLEKRGIRFVCLHGNPADVAKKLARPAAIVVCDRGYLRHQKRWRDDVADGATCCVVEVETDVVVPVEVASNKREFAARTIRPKIAKHRDTFLTPVRARKVKHGSLKLKLELEREIDVSNPEAALAALKVDRSVKPSSFLVGGEDEASRRLSDFVKNKIGRYDEDRSEPSGDGTSILSAYLHFGQVSPVEIALAVRNAASGKSRAAETYLEELIVRRELAMNYARYEPQYDAYSALPDWARKTLKKHAKDKRPVTYMLKQLEACDTHDPHWNAAMREMTALGYMHNSMRMYWGKKIIEWSKTPEQAFKTALYLNNKYFLDGRDPNSFVNVAWLFGLHDRPWGERAIFGTVRYMNAGGLERKFDMDAYAARVEKLRAREKLGTDLS